MKKIAVQLYSVRDHACKDFTGTLKKIADIGFAAVEPAGFWNIRPSEFKKIVNDMGMEITSAHSPWVNNPDCLGEAMDTADAIGLKTVTTGYAPDNFKDMDAIKRTAENTNKLIEILSRNGYSLMQHNHHFEFERLDGRLKYEIYREICPQVNYQLDSFWSTCLGKEDPVEMLKLFSDKVVSVHIKDGFCRQDIAETENVFLSGKVVLQPVGTGSMPIPELMANIPDRVRYIIVELDNCEQEMFEALKCSYEYLVSNGFACGQK